MEEALVSEIEQPYGVPENWIWTRMGDVIKINPSKPKLDLPHDQPCSFLPMNKVNPQTGKVDSLEEREFEKVKKGYTYFEENDVLFAKITPCMENGNIVIANGLINKFGFGSTEFYVFRTSEKIDERYVYFLLRSEKFRKQARAEMTGAVGQQRVPKKFLESYPFALPPLSEQKRIADKVEHLLSKIDEAKQLIEEAKETFELRRAAILDKAFRGELTRKWRGENADITTANEWIEQINLLKEGTKTKYKDQLDSSILEKLYELPREWKWVRLNDLIEASTYGTSAKTNDDVTGTPVLRMGNIVDGYLELNNLKYLPNNHEDVLKYDLQTNDLLFNRTNSYELVGKTSVITEDVSERFTFASYLIRVRLFYKDFLASYVSHYINSHVGRKILLSMVTQQVGQANINSQKLASLPIPLPSQEEVMEITSWLNNYRELESKQKEMILVEENIEALKQSILSKAFRGELGTNDPSEESAIELLKEVLQEQVN
nr:restriction endonuclease subunit S [Bacillus safensis]